MIAEIQKEYFKKKRDEYLAAMLDAKAIKNHTLANEMHTLYNEYNKLI
tara:strand:+ start:440 stop:583 length:144 start_codon:yes stop_codon:yes gene_type:complete